MPVCGASSRMRGMSSSPPMPGIERSRSTTSGFDSTIPVNAEGPSSASPTISNDGSSSKLSRMRRRMSATSSQRKTRVMQSAPKDRLDPCDELVGTERLLHVGVRARREAAFDVLLPRKGAEQDHRQLP